MKRLFLSLLTLSLTPLLDAQVVTNSGFEVPPQGAGQYQYRPTGTPWSFNAQSGLSATASAFTIGNPAPPDGGQVAFLQSKGTFSQAVANVPAGTYQISFSAAQRATHQAVRQDFQVSVDGQPCGTFTPAGTTYQGFTTAAFTVADGPHTITFQGLNTAGGDNTALIDRLALTGGSGFAVPDASFEQMPLGTGKYQYAASGPAWTFNSQSGVTANGSQFTSGNPAAPEGGQVAFLQGTGSLNQSVAGWLDGSYQVAFSAAQRATGTGTRQDFRISLDGQSLGVFNPGGPAYVQYVTPAFTAAAGSHTLAFQALNSAGGDNTAFLDAVSVIPAGSIAPKAVAVATVATSGKMISLTFNAVADGKPVLPAQVVVPPQLLVNGQPVGTLGRQWLTGYHPVALLATPNNFQIRQGDQVRLSGPDGWAATSAGMVRSLDSMSVENRTGKPMLATETLPRNLRIGINNAQYPYDPGLGYYAPLKNMKYRTGWPPTNRGKIVGMPVSLSLSNHAGSNYIDGTNYPGPAGLWAVVWDQRPGQPPVQFSITTQTPTKAIVTERPDLARAPPDGIGCTRVFAVEPIAGLPSADFDVSIACVGPPSNVPAYDNLWVLAPGDVEIVGGQVVLDRSDPWALSKTYLARVGPNVGSMRWVDSTVTGGNPGSFPYPENLPRSTDENWGPLAFQQVTVGYTSVGPVDPVATPWIYSPFFRGDGQSFPATLAAPITTAPAPGTKETWTFTDADTAPLMAGLELTLDSEVCRVVSGSGQVWVVNRGSNGTTPATHDAVAVSVSGRVPISRIIGANGQRGAGGFAIQFTTASPHGRTTGNTMNCYGTGWPAVTMDSGETWNPSGSATWLHVTGPNTVVALVNRPGVPAKPARTYPLDPSKQQWQGRFGGGIPIEVAAIVTAKFPKADFHVNVPLDAVDDTVWEIARRVLANFPSGRRVYVEYANEPWNWSFTAFYYHSGLMGPLRVPGQYQLADYAYRASQVHGIFRQAFAAAGRGGEVRGIINCQMGSSATQITPHLELGLKLGQPFDAVAQAPYWSLENTAYNKQTAAALDDDQFLDVVGADQRTNPRNVNAWLVDATKAIASYNQAHGASVAYYGYEGGIEYADPWNGGHNHDLIYNPNWYAVELDWLATCQKAGLERLNVYSLAQWWAPAAWGGYHHELQRPGRGDGLNGGADNRLWRARGKAAGVNQDLHVDSVRGQAWLDWLGTVGP